MRLGQVTLALISVGAISCGQLLFKRAGIDIEAADDWLNVRALTTIGVAAVIYGVATLLWISVLRSVPLNKAYLFMALSFVLVPLASSALYGERLSAGLLLGCLLVISGIVVGVKFG